MFDITSVPRRKFEHLKFPKQLSESDRDDLLAASNRLLEHTGNDAALIRYSTLVDIEPSNVNYLYSVGLYAMAMRHYQDAYYLFLHALKINPAEHGIHLALGQALKETDNSQLGDLLNELYMDYYTQYDSDLTNRNKRQNNMLVQVNLFSDYSTLKVTVDEPDCYSAIQSSGSHCNKDIAPHRFYGYSKILYFLPNKKTGIYTLKMVRENNYSVDQRISILLTYITNQGLSNERVKHKFVEMPANQTEMILDSIIM